MVGGMFTMISKMECTQDVMVGTMLHTGALLSKKLVSISRNGTN